jgi:hypothetical protein
LDREGTIAALHREFNWPKSGIVMRPAEHRTLGKDGRGKGEVPFLGAFLSLTRSPFVIGLQVLPLPQLTKYKRRFISGKGAL